MANHKRYTLESFKLYFEELPKKRKTKQKSKRGTKNTKHNSSSRLDNTYRSISRRFFTQRKPNNDTNGRVKNKGKTKQSPKGY